MNKYFCILVQVVLGLTFLSCGNDEINNFANDKVCKGSEEYIIPLGKALKRAELFLNELDKSQKTRSKERTILSVERLGHLTRVSGSEYGYYYYNSNLKFFNRNATFKNEGDVIQNMPQYYFVHDYVVGF